MHTGESREENKKVIQATCELDAIHIRPRYNTDYFDEIGKGTMHEPNLKINQELADPLLAHLYMPIEPVIEHIRSLSEDEMSGIRKIDTTPPFPAPPPRTLVRVEDTHVIWERPLTPPPPSPPPAHRSRPQRPPYPFLLPHERYGHRHSRRSNDPG